MPLQTLILKSFEIEIILNKQLKIYHQIPTESPIPNIKIFKFEAIWRKNSWLFWGYLTCAVVFSVFKQFWDLMILGLLPCEVRVLNHHHNVLSFATSPAGRKIIDAIIRKNQAERIDIKIETTREIVSLLDAKDKADVLRLYLQVVRCVLRNPSITVLLLCMDLMRLICLCKVIVKYKNIDVYSDDHMQRFAYIFSNLSDRFNLCQHGQQDTELDVGKKYGRIFCLWENEDNARHAFSKFFKFIDQVESQDTTVTFFSPKQRFGIPDGVRVVFVASSLPNFMEEAALLSSLTAQEKTFVILKFHPSHPYSWSQRRSLQKCVDYLCTSDEYPVCDELICSKDGSIMHIYEGSETHVRRLGI